MAALDLRSGFLARNMVLNFFGQVIPLIVGIAAIPAVIQGLGVDRFGILSLAWMLLGYFTLFDLGLGRATTKFIAEELRTGVTERFRSLFWTSSAISFSLGVIGGLILASLASVLAERVFKIPAALIPVAREAFLILAFSMPVVLVSTALRGALEAAQRFDYVNSVKVVASSLTFLLPVLGLLLGFDLPGIILLLILARLCSALAYLVLCLRAFSILKKGISFDLKVIRPVFRFGGWVSVSNVIDPVLSYLDRFLIGSVISMAAVAYYTAPFEMVTRLWILPVSLTMTLFPAFSAIGAASREILTRLFVRSVKYLLLVIVPLVMILILFAEEILHLWLGAEFAEKSTGVFCILALGVLFNSSAHIPFVLIQGLGRPDITAKFHTIESLLYLPLAWFLIRNQGITGAALAWAIRVTLDAVLLYVVSGRFVDRQAFSEIGLRRVLSVLALMACAALALFLLQGTVVAKGIAVVSLLVFFVAASWRYLLDSQERELISSTARQFVSLSGGSR